MASYTIKEYNNTQRSEYKFKIGEYVGSLLILDLIRLPNGNTKTQKGYRYKCINCNNEDTTKETHLTRGARCNVCGKSTYKTLIGYNDIATTSPWMIELLKDKQDAYIYRDKSEQKIWFKCPYCGEERLLTINKVFYHGIACKKCGDGISYPNKFMSNLLHQLTINFESEFSPNWIKPKRYDFYFKIDNKKYIVEMDGALGHGKKIYNSSKLTKKETLNIDIYKDNIANKHRIHVIRINCDRSEPELIKKNILNSELNDLFDLSNIDWIECHKAAILNSRVIESCNLWNNGITSTKKIGEIININRTNVSKYLTKGAILGICNYDAQKERMKAYKVSGRHLKDIFGLKVVCLNNGKVYNSRVDAGKDINVSSAHIASCCTGNRLSCGEINGERLVWRDLETYKKMSIDEIDQTLKNINNTPNGSPKKIICLETKLVYESGRDAFRKTGISFQSINRNLRNKTKTAGGCHWMYYEDWLKSNNNKEININT